MTRNNRRQNDPVRTIAPYGPPWQAGYHWPVGPEFAEDYYAGNPDPGAGYWDILMRYKGMLLVISFLGALCAFLLTVPQTPVYRAKASLEVQGLNENFLNMRDLSPTAAGGLASPDLDVQTQTRVLRTQALLERTLAKHGELEGRFIEAMTAGRGSMWRKALGIEEPNERSRREQVLGHAAASIGVRAQPNTRVIDVTIDSTDPRLAADFANALSSEFIELRLEERWQTTQRTSEWLVRQLQELKIKLEKSEEELQAYARTTGLVFTGEKDNIAEERLRQLQDELSKAQTDRIVKQSRYELTAKRAAETLPEILDDSTLREQQLELTRLRREAAELSATFTPAHPKVLKLEAQIAAVENAVQKKRDNIVTRIHNEYEAAQRREQLLLGDYAAQVRLMSGQADKVTHYNILKREVDTTRQLYDSIFQRVKEAGVASALRASNIQIIDPAQPPQRPFKPNMRLNLAMGLAGGLFLAVAAVLVRDRSDRRILAPGDTEFYLNVAELGVIPTDEQRRLGWRSRSPSPIPAASEGAAERLELVTFQRRLSPVAEAFRTTLTSILFSQPNGAPPRVLVVSSAGSAEGKTTVISNLAIAVAQAGQRVLLIDGDIRKPRLHGIFEVSRNPGLTDALSGQPTLRANETSVPNLFLIPSGSGGDANILFSPALGGFIQRLRDEFDIVLIDTPPLLQMPDARVLGRQADAVVLVVRAQRTTRDVARLARERLLSDGIPVLGAILTDWKPKGHSAYGYESYRAARYSAEPEAGRAAAAGRPVNDE